MILPKSSDLLTEAVCRTSHIRLVFVDTTDSARTLEQRHLCGPTAGLVLAETLAGAALLTADLSEPEEAISLRMDVDGPIKGVLAEGSADGGLRGYTHVKILNEFDERDEVESVEALGTQGRAQIIRSAPGRVINQATVDTRPPSVADMLNQYFNLSLQTPTSVSVCAVSYDSYLGMARGVMAQCMPDGDWAAYQRIQRLFADGTIAENLEGAPGLSSLMDLFALPAPVIHEPRKLHFACRCSQARAEHILTSLSLPELQEMRSHNKPQQIFCHMCGEGYPIPIEALNRLIAAKAAE